MKCPKCGNALPITAKGGQCVFCVHCNRKVRAPHTIAAAKPSARELMEMAKWKRSDNMPASPGEKLVCARCPACGCPKFTRTRPKSLVAFAYDRVCTACQTRYSPPTPWWAAALFIFFGLFLVAGGGSSTVIAVIRGAYIIAVVQFVWTILGLYCLRLGLKAYLVYVPEPPDWNETRR